MVEQQQQTAGRSTPPPHALDGSDSQDHRSVQPIEDDDHDGCPRSLLADVSTKILYRHS